MLNEHISESFRVCDFCGERVPIQESFPVCREITWEEKDGKERPIYPPSHDWTEEEERKRAEHIKEFPLDDREERYICHPCAISMEGFEGTEIGEHISDLLDSGEIKDGDKIILPRFNLKTGEIIKDD